jgi:hypothetical protein
MLNMLIPLLLLMMTRMRRMGGVGVDVRKKEQQ